MADVAALGLAVDSSQVKSATAALGQLNAAANSAAKGADTLAQAGAKSETMLRAIDSAAKRAGISTAEYQARTDAFKAATERMTTAQGKAGQAMVALSAQSKSAVNDNTGLTMAADKSTNAFEKLGNTLTRRVLFAFAAKEVRDLAQYIWNLNAAISATADAAQKSGVNGGTYQGLQTAGAYKGVSNDEFNSAMLSFNQQINLAKNGLGDLQILLRSNGKTVSDTATTFGIVADLVKAATGNYALQASVLQQAGLPASLAFVKLMEQGADAIKKQGDAATKLTAQQLEDAQKLNDEWNKLWTNFENWGKRSILGVLDAAKALKNAVPVPAGAGELDPSIYGTGFALPKPTTNPLNYNPKDFASPKGSVISAPLPPIVKPPVDPNVLKQTLGLEQQRIGIMGQSVTVADQLALKQKEINIALIDNNRLTPQQAENAQKSYEAQLMGAQLSARADLGLADASEIANQKLRELNALVTNGTIKLGENAAAADALARKYQDVADRSAIAASALPQLTALSLESGRVDKQLDAFATTSFNAVTPALRDMLNGTTSAAAGFKNLGITILTALEDAIIKIMIIKPLIEGLKSSLSGSGILSFLHLGGSNDIAAGGTIPGAEGMTSVGGAPLSFAAANGGTFGPGWGVVGERGPELINVHSGGVTVVPNHISRSMIPGFADGGMLSAGGAVTRMTAPSVEQSQTHVTVGVSVDENGNLQAFVKDIATSTTSKGIDQFSKSPGFVHHVANASQKAKSQRLL